MHIAVLEDEVCWISQLRDAARDARWTFDAFSNSQGLIDSVNRRHFDAIITDIHLATNTENGVETLKQLRRSGVKLPVLILTQFNGEHRVSDTLDAGADDYMVKPFDGDELAARLRAMIRRAGQSDATLLNIGPLRISRYHKSVHWMDVPIPLRGQGFDILAVLAEFRGDVVSREVLWKSVWREFERVPPQVRPIETAISRVRKDVQQVTCTPVIATVSRCGYRLAVNEW